MAQTHKHDIRDMVKRHLEKIRLEGATTGEEDFVVLDPEFIKGRDIAGFGTLVIGECEVTGKRKLTYRVGPKHYVTERKPMKTNIPDLEGWIDSYKDGKKPSNLADLIPDKIEASVGEEHMKSLSTQNHFEKWFLARTPKVIMVDPAEGSLWRAVQIGQTDVQILMTAGDEQWGKDLISKFAPEFRKVHRTVSLTKTITSDSPVYHGTNGLKSWVKSSRSFALEPNPFSKDRREEQLIVKMETNGIKMHYTRKREGKVYEFKDKPSHFRVDPLSLFKSIAVRGDAFFFCSTFDPANWGISSTTTRPLSMANVYHLEEWKQGNAKWVEIEGQEYQIATRGKRKVVMDVKVNATYLSKYHLLQQLEGYDPPQLVKGPGKWTVHPYSSVPYMTSIVRYGQSYVCEDYGMYNKECPEDVVPSQMKALQFRVGDMSGTLISPLEKIGSVFPVSAWERQGDPRRYVIPDRSNSYYFSGKQALLQWLFLIVHNETGSMSSVIDYESEQTTYAPVSAHDEDQQLAQVHWRDALLEMITLSPTPQQVERAFPDVPKSQWMDVLLRSQVVIDQDRFVPGDKEYDEIDTEGTGLMSLVSQLHLKRELMDLQCTFPDEEDANIDSRMKDAEFWGFKCQVVESDDEGVTRIFRQERKD
jgi:hypothetical protein